MKKIIETIKLFFNHTKLLHKYNKLKLEYEILEENVKNGLYKKVTDKIEKMKGGKE